MHQDEVVKIFTKCFNKVGKKWPLMIDELKKASTKDDESQILMTTFTKILAKFGFRLKEEDEDKIDIVLGGDSFE